MRLWNVRCNGASMLCSWLCLLKGALLWTLNAAHAFEVLDIYHRAAVDGHSVKSAFRGISLQVHPDGSAGYRPRRARPQVAPKWTGCKPNKGVITCLYHDQSPLLSRARTRARRRSKWSTKSPHRVA